MTETDLLNGFCEIIQRGHCVSHVRGEIVRWTWDGPRGATVTVVGRCQIPVARRLTAAQRDKVQRIEERRAAGWQS